MCSPETSQSSKFPLTGDDIECVGAGVQRFQFKEHKLGPKQVVVNGGSEPTTTLIRQPRASRTIKVSYDFMSAFNQEDLRYDLIAYGPFLQGIPRRLGHSAALDASASAVVTALGAYRRGKRADPEALASYGRALAALRAALGNPATAGAPDTLCSIYLILISQGWLGSEDLKSLQHGEAIAFILKSASAQDFQGEFENYLILTLVVPVILEALMNPKIILDSWLDKLLDKYMQGKFSGTFAAKFPSCSIRTIARVPGIVRDPIRHLPYVGFAYETIKIDVANMREVYARIEKKYLDGAGSSKEAQQNLRMYGSMQTIAGIILTVGILFGGLLACDDPSKTEIVEEVAQMRREALALSKSAAVHRPLGTGYMTMMLLVAWSSSDDSEEMSQLWDTVCDYAADFPPTEWTDEPIWLRSVFDTVRLTKLAEASGIEPGSELSVEAQYCVVM
ncbi:hypothetical protein HJFPF1_06872 [Paramyrothecium foliicola]|nr:hypothetical protein HJFPF1_06872 [Paramyrothecium foliicola]